MKALEVGDLRFVKRLMFQDVPCFFLCGDYSQVKVFPVSKILSPSAAIKAG